ncbi:MAG: sigma-70 family RNA polymerase sigma factor, partial [Planctomycetes bacterium]|nr:sigma-70 family RNA polymerase sigma factor [Planctomycetota bacterium]
PRDLRSRFDPEDVIQSTFLAAFEHIKEFEYRGDGSFRAWLRRILDNSLRDGIKHHCRAKRSPSLEKSVEHEGADPLADRRSGRPEELAGEAEDVRRLRLAVLRLPADLREIVELRVDQGWTFGDIAEQLCCSPTTIRRRVQTALDHIQHDLGHAAAG